MLRQGLENSHVDLTDYDIHFDHHLICARDFQSVKSTRVYQILSQTGGIQT